MDVYMICGYYLFFYDWDFFCHHGCYLLMVIWVFFGLFGIFFLCLAHGIMAYFLGGNYLYVLGGFMVFWDFLYV